MNIWVLWPILHTSPIGYMNSLRDNDCLVQTSGTKAGQLVTQFATTPWVLVIDQYTIEIRPMNSCINVLYNMVNFFLFLLIFATDATIMWTHRKGQKYVHLDSLIYITVMIKGSVPPHGRKMWCVRHLPSMVKCGYESY